MLISVKAIAPLVDDTYESIGVIMKSKDVILQKIDSITSISEETSASSEEISASSEEMNVRQMIDLMLVEVVDSAIVENVFIFQMILAT